MGTPTDLMGFSIPPFAAGELGNTSKAYTAAGTVTGTATALLNEYHICIVTAATSQTGVILPAGAKVGTPYYIIGVGTAAPVIYPPTGGTINAGAANAGLTLSGATATAILIRSDPTATAGGATSPIWYSFPLAP